ncbi:hypothetical protein BY458DRAFT_548931 [Sporodiniella umbellata]|nr:hypothetical protein BY458DRAFT_548931 [Sporodiniella umbellata]
MSSALSRSNRIKKPVLSHEFKDLNKTKTLYKKKKQMRTKKDNNAFDPDYRLQYHQEEALEPTDSPVVDPSEHPDYERLMSGLEDSKKEKLEKIQIWKAHEHNLILNWFSSQKERLWNEYYLQRKGARTQLLDRTQNELLRIKKEMSQLDRQSKTQHQAYDYSGWVPPERLYTIGSFVGGATDEEIQGDLSVAQQTYSTPNLTYSDYESRSTTDIPMQDRPPLT